MQKASRAKKHMRHYHTVLTQHTLPSIIKELSEIPKIYIGELNIHFVINNYPMQQIYIGYNYLCNQI
jgi:hypothetical protein